MSSLSDIVPAGVITGDDVLTLFDHARTNGYAIPGTSMDRLVVVLAEPTHCAVGVGCLWTRCECIVYLLTLNFLTYNAFLSFSRQLH